jgi:hypothetical protein
MAIARQRVDNTHIRVNEQMLNKQLLGNISITHPRQRTDAGSDELLDVVMNIRFASKLQ